MDYSGNIQGKYGTASPENGFWAITMHISFRFDGSWEEPKCGFLLTTRYRWSLKHTKITKKQLLFPSFYPFSVFFVPP